MALRSIADVSKGCFRALIVIPTVAATFALALEPPGVSVWITQRVRATMLSVIFNGELAVHVEVWYVKDGDIPTVC
jgi:hypothetical protein